MTRRVAKLESALGAVSAKPDDIDVTLMLGKLKLLADGEVGGLSEPFRDAVRWGFEEIVAKRNVGDS